MKTILTLTFALCQLISYSQPQYDSVFTCNENDSVDLNNEIYKVGNAFVYDYEIILNENKQKLKTNIDSYPKPEFEFAPAESDSLAVNHLHLIVRPVEGEKRIHKLQTQIEYIPDPVFNEISLTGAVENKENVWIHPIRTGFFGSLETAPFPYVKRPLEIGTEWSDKMLIGENWSNDLWGKWTGSLLINYHYKIIGKTTLKTKIGEIECHIIKSTAESKIGTSTLTSYFSEKHGFMRMEYQLLNMLEVKLWLIDFKEDLIFNDNLTIFNTKTYIKTK